MLVGSTTRRTGGRCARLLPLFVTALFIVPNLALGQQVGPRDTLQPTARRAALANPPEKKDKEPETPEPADDRGPWP